MKVNLLDTVAVKDDVPELGLHAGDSAVVIELHAHGEIELEFIDSEGGTIGLLQLDPSQVRQPTRAEVEHHLLPRPGEPFMERLENGKLWVRHQPAK